MQGPISKAAHALLFLSFIRNVSSSSSSSGTTLSKPSGTMSGSAPSGSAPAGGGAGGSGNSDPSSMYLTGLYTLDNATVTNSSSVINCSTADENAILVTNGALAHLTGFSVLKSSGDTTSEDDSNFFGLNAAVCAQNSSTLYFADSTISSSSAGSNGLFSTGDGTVTYATNVNITTTKDSSRGMDSTHGGFIYASNVRISTKGAHCAAFANDRGGGTTVVDTASVFTSGQGSPSIYCTGNITASNIEGVSTGSQCVVVEGINNVTLKESNLKCYAESAVMLYQSESGDAESGLGLFTMTGGSLAINTTSSPATNQSLTKADGAIFYVTNQRGLITLWENVTVSGTGGVLIKATIDQWGKSNSNGGSLLMVTNSVSLSGSILADSLSSVSLTLDNSSSLSGYVPVYGGQVGIELDTSSTWSLSGNSFLWNFTDENTSFSNIKDNGYSIYYNTSSAANSYLNSTSYTLVDGGKLLPWTSNDNSNSTTSAASTISTSTGSAATSHKTTTSQSLATRVSVLSNGLVTLCLGFLLLVM